MLVLLDVLREQHGSGVIAQRQQRLRELEIQATDHPVDGAEQLCRCRAYTRTSLSCTTRPESKTSTAPLTLAKNGFQTLRPLLPFHGAEPLLDHHLPPVPRLRGVPIEGEVQEVFVVAAEAVIASPTSGDRDEVRGPGFTEQRLGRNVVASLLRIRLAINARFARPLPLELLPPTLRRTDARLRVSGLQVAPCTPSKGSHLSGTSAMNREMSRRP